MDFDVTIDRAAYIGGSDIPAIMGISTFKTRYELLLEKAGLKESDFSGNKYTVYGQKIEPKIRDYINLKHGTNFEPNRIINGDFRGHTDGFNGECVLEIKSTSHIYETVDEYLVYLVQLLKYMQENHVEKGLLAVYERPKDFNTEFDPQRLQEYPINLVDYQDLLWRVNAEIERFRADLDRLRENPLLAEEDFQPSEIVEVANKVVALERQLVEIKAVEKRCKDAKQQLYDEMKKYNVKSWELYNGTRISRVDGVEASTETVVEFDVDKFASENPDVYKQYCRQVKKKNSGRKGYVRITLKE